MIKTKINSNIQKFDQVYLEITKKDIKSIIQKINMQERSMPICFTTDQYKKIESIAKQKGMLNTSQLIEEVLNEV